MNNENTKEVETNDATASELKRLLFEFIGERVKFDDSGTGYIWGVNGENLQMIGEVRGYGAIQNLFKKEDGTVDFGKADNFQDYLGCFIAEAITEKLERDKRK